MLEESVLCSGFVGEGFVTASYDQRVHISPNYSPAVNFLLKYHIDIFFFTDM